jgi:SHS2 domain-containing protein
MAKKGSFRFLDDIAPADAAFEATGSDLGAVFAAAAQALFSIIIDIDLLEPRHTRRVSLDAESLEALLYAWLSELVYLKDVHRQLYCEFDVETSQEDGFHLEATISGDGVENHTGQTLTDVKAITYHELAIVQTPDGFKATVVVDL